MKNRTDPHFRAAVAVNPASREGRLRANLGDRLLQMTTHALWRFAGCIERTCGLPPEATQDALKRFSVRSRVALSGAKSIPRHGIAAQPQQALAGRRK